MNTKVKTIFLAGFIFLNYICGDTLSALAFPWSIPQEGIDEVVARCKIYYPDIVDLYGTQQTKDLTDIGFQAADYYLKNSFEFGFAGVKLVVSRNALQNQVAKAIEAEVSDRGIVISDAATAANIKSLARIITARYCRYLEKEDKGTCVLKNTAEELNRSSNKSQELMTIDNLRLCNASVKISNRGEVVGQLQQYLASLGYLPSNSSDGIFGPQTLAAVRQYQKENGLKSDGIVGCQTFTALEKNIYSMD